jgi:iron complex outermembrane recepter protein
VDVYMDDLPLTSFSIITPEISPYDMASVEVLRGPQGTLFGSGTLAGAVRFVTNKPKADRVEASVDGDIGYTKGDSWRRRGSGMVNLPLVKDELAVRVVGYYRDEDGYVDNIGTGVKNADTTKAHGVRGSLRWDPAGPFSLTLMATDDHNKLGDTNRYTARLGKNISNSRIPYRSTVGLQTYNSTLGYDFGFANFTSSTTYSTAKTAYQLDLNTVTVLPLFAFEQVRSKTWVEDARLVSKSGTRFEWVVGGFYLNQKFDQLFDNYVTQGFLTTRNITGLRRVTSPGIDVSNIMNHNKNFEAAFYGEGSFHFTPELTFSAGFRETFFEYSSRGLPSGFSATTALIGAVAAGGNRTIAATPNASTFITTHRHSKLTQKYSLTWKPDREKTFYISASQGFRRSHPNSTALINGGRSPVDPADPTIIPGAAAPDTLWNYEAGAKLLLLDRHLTVNMAGYYIPWKSIQVGLVRPSDAQPFVGNVGKVVAKGIELETQLRLPEDISLGMNLTLQRSKVTRLTALEARVSGAAVGNRLASPGFQISGYLQKDWRLVNGSSLFARADALHVGSYPNGFPRAPGSGLPNSNYFIIPSYENVNLSLGWSNDHLKIAVYGENVLNGLTPTFINASGSSTNRYTTLRPRTVGVRLGWAY